MKVFLSWSGTRSQALARAIREWLPDVLPTAEPWMSDTDIHAFSRWSKELGEVLEDCSLAILCLTPDNVDAPWVLFEAGAVSKVLSESSVCPLLFGVTAAELSGPLAQFQAVQCDRGGLLSLCKGLNTRLGDQRMTDERVVRFFDRSWRTLESRLRLIPGITVTPSSGGALPAEIEYLKAELGRQSDGIKQLLALLTPKAPSSTPLDLRGLDGIWVNPETHTTYCVQVRGDHFKAVYDYGDTLRATGEYDGAVLGEAIVGRFRWFDDTWSGFFYLRPSGPKRLEGGWWSDEDVPDETATNLGLVSESLPGMARYAWQQISENGAFPKWASGYLDRQDLARSRRSSTVSANR